MPQDVHEYPDREPSTSLVETFNQGYSIHADVDSDSDSDGLGPSKTPPKHVLELSKIPADVKTQVDAATAPLNGSRCLLENTLENGGVNYVHAVSHSMTSNSIVISPHLVL